MQQLTLGLRPYRTDLTACHRCGGPVTLEDSTQATDGTLFCPGCVAAAVAAHQVQAATRLP